MLSKGMSFDEIECAESFAQVKLRFDKRIPPKCPRCHGVLPKNKMGKSCIMDSPLAHLNTIWILFLQFKADVLTAYIM
jgi:hypothetical protein